MVQADILVLPELYATNQDPPLGSLFHTHAHIEIHNHPPAHIQTPPTHTSFHPPTLGYLRSDVSISDMNNMIMMSLMSKSLNKFAVLICTWVSGNT